MLRKKYVFLQKHYDYFANGTKYRRYEFNSLVDALKEYRHEKSFDYNYEDSFTETYGIHAYFIYIPDIQRPHIRTRYEWDNLCNRDKHNKFEYLQNFDVDDEEILI